MRVMSRLLRALALVATLLATHPAMADVAPEPDCKCATVGGESSPAVPLVALAGALLGAAVLVVRRQAGR